MPQITAAERQLRQVLDDLLRDGLLPGQCATLQVVLDVYRYLMIVSQVWLAFNLKVRHTDN